VKILINSFCTLAITLILGSNLALAHGDHSLPDEGVIEMMTEMKIEEMVEKGKLSASWRGLKPESIKKRAKRGSEEWVATFQNQNEKTKAKKNLYIFYSTYGDFIAVNHSGK
jgi:hypothetical protein